MSRRTNDATRFIDHNKFTLDVMTENFDGSRCHRWFVTMNHVSFDRARINIMSKLEGSLNALYTVTIS
jgi:hypothetical protein